ncbi:MAG: hypothetical protein ABIN97_20875 [Ginsengibacter sp.]
MSIIKFKKNRPIIDKEYDKKQRDQVIQTFTNDNAVVDELINNIPAIKLGNLPKQDLAASFKKLINTIDNCT